MCPELHFVLGGFHFVFSPHALLVLVGVVLGAGVAVRTSRLPVGVVLLAVAVVATAGIAGARCLNVLQRGGELVDMNGGMASFGGIVAGLGAIVLVARVTRVRTAALFDAIAPAFLVAFGCGRIGCFFAGCCSGFPTTVPWGTVFPMVGPEPRHPLQLYSALFDFVLARWALGRGGAPGMVAVRCAVGLGFGRAALEWLRDPTATDFLWSGGPTVPQVCGVALGLGAWWIGHTLERKPKFASAS